MSENEGNGIDPAHYRTLTFDCYGTLIDWETGILAYLKPLFESYDVHVIDEFVLDCYSRYEPDAQAEGGSYRSVLARVLERFGKRLAVHPQRGRTGRLRQQHRAVAPICGHCRVPGVALGAFRSRRGIEYR